RSRSSPHRWAADFDVTDNRVRSRYRWPLANRVITSTCQPPRLYGLTRTLIAVSPFRRPRGLLAQPLYQIGLADEHATPDTNDAGELRALDHRVDCLLRRAQQDSNFERR